ncbi:MAG TPA: class I SAM-dependent methyltransferase [Pyrinomonadaceae bacterium]|jgi:ubiquinone/menaquinone biosynthesis C-methylase UbiE|nr:class I SAM-dependent methyltransferase [Pyrinomonadaceae bacterium]
MFATTSDDRKALKGVGAGAAADVEGELEAAIDPWLEHMRWRADFAEWREGRLWQEKRQKGTLNNLRAFLRAAGGPSAGDPLAGRLVLDLGCGMGGLSTALSLEGADVRPLDFNRHYCHITRLRGMRHRLDLSPINAAGEALPFPDAHFDIIMCVDVLEHVRDPEALVAEVSRCLKPGGLCQITAINRFAFRDPHYHARFVNYLPRRLSDAYLRLAGRPKESTLFKDRQSLREMHYYTYRGLERLLARHGLAGLAESGELKLKGRLRGWKGLLQRAGLAGLAYRAYRGLYKSTYVCMAVKR